MSDTPRPPTLDRPHPKARDFEGAWRAWKKGEQPPQWEQFLPLNGEPCSPDLILLLVMIDIEFRAKNGLPALLSERYFDQPRLQEEDARLNAKQQVEIICWDYEQRWKNGQRARRGDYEAAFPQHAGALRNLKPRSPCLYCSKMIVLEETVQVLRCPHCGAESPSGEGIPPYVAEMTQAEDSAPVLDLRDYELIEPPLGMGGMGEVYRTRDPALGRDLAIKVMKDEFRGNAEMEDRFLREARVTASLQHPGIVPVHNLGRLADGRLYYTMRLVRGGEGTLADILKKDVANRERLSYLLGIFENVCQALAYAHSKRVIHRDLTPHNVMIDRFGEVQVMDWGLTKLLTPKKGMAAPETYADTSGTHIFTESDDTPAHLSRAGSGMGKPAYMPPEQAWGEWDQVDERADVFALGAILCEILTGRPPYIGRNGEELFRQAQRGNLAEARGRLEKCGADAALTALCRECLSPEREKRPPNAEAVAKRVADYQAQVQERLRQAEREKFLDQPVRNAFVRAELLEEQARADALQPHKFHQALEAAQVAAQLAENASAELRRQAEDLVKRLEQAEQAAEKDRELLAALLDVHGPCEGRKHIQPNESLTMTLAEPTADEQFAAAFRKWGLDVENRDISESVALLKARPPVVVMGVIIALDEWANARRRKGNPKAEWQRLADLAAALDDDPGSKWRELREILLGEPLADTPSEQHRDRLRQLAEQMDLATEPLPGLLMLLRELRANGEGTRVEQMLRAAILARPREVVLYDHLGHFLASQEPPRWAEAVECYRAMRALRPELGLHLADALIKAGRVQEGLDLHTHLVKEWPKNFFLHLARGDALAQREQWDEAVFEARQAIALAPNSAMAHCGLGVGLREKGQSDEAIDEFRQAIEIDPKYALSHAGLGSVLARKGQGDEAIAEYRHAIALDPKYAPTHFLLGIALIENRQWDEAIAVYRQYIALEPDSAEGHNNLGVALRNKGLLDEAIAEFRRAIALDPRDIDAQVNLKTALDAKLPAVLSGQQSPADAHEAITLAQRCRKPHAAARLYAYAFADEPELADNPQQRQHRYNAACNAARAAGQGEDAGSLSCEVTRLLRNWALDWLHADLKAYAQLAEQDNPGVKQLIQQRLAHWQRDSDFTSVRDLQALDHLPDDERAAWQALWRDVDELRKRVAE